MTGYTRKPIKNFRFLKKKHFKNAFCIGENSIYKSYLTEKFEIVSFL